MIGLSLAPGLAEALMIAFARIGTLVMLLPGLGERVLPARQRLVLALALTVIVLPEVREGLAAAPGMPVRHLIAEVLLGLALGIMARLTLAALDVAGVVMSQTVGLSMAMVLDPSRGQQGDILSGFLRMFGLTLIFAADLHHVALAGIVGSYGAVPVGAGLPIGDLAELMIRLMGEVFHTGLRIAAPFLVFGLVFNVGLGLAAKLAPQVQLFFLAMPAGILMGLAALALILAVTARQIVAHTGAVFTLLFPAGG